MTARPTRSAKLAALSAIELNSVDKTHLNGQGVVVERRQQYLIVDLDDSDNGESDDSEEETLLDEADDGLPHQDIPTADAVDDDDTPPP